MRPYRKWRTLDGEQRSALLEALWLLPRMHLTLRVSGYEAARRRHVEWDRQRSRATAPSEPARRDTAARCRWAVDVASRYGLVAGTCLSRSLVLLALLKRRGIEGQLCFGAARSGSKLDAHAWIELDGVALNDAADVATRYAALGRRDSGSH